MTGSATPADSTCRFDCRWADHQAVDLIREFAGQANEFSATLAVDVSLAIEESCVEGYLVGSDAKRLIATVVLPDGLFDGRPRIKNNASSRARIEHWLAQPWRVETTAA